MVIPSFSVTAKDCSALSALNAASLLAEVLSQTITVPSFEAVATSGVVSASHRPVMVCAWPTKDPMHSCAGSDHILIVPSCDAETKHLPSGVACIATMGEV